LASFSVSQQPIAGGVGATLFAFPVLSLRRLLQAGLAMPALLVMLVQQHSSARSRATIILTTTTHPFFCSHNSLQPRPSTCRTWQIEQWHEQGQTESTNIYFFPSPVARRKNEEECKGSVTCFEKERGRRAAKLEGAFAHFAVLLTPLSHPFSLSLSHTHPPCRQCP
jgi:hypothetical protein